MAKRSFVMYESWIDMIISLPDDQALQLMRAICKYHKNSDYEITDLVLRTYFDTTIRPEMDANEQKYKSKVERMNKINDVARSRNDVVRSRNDVVRSRNDVVSDNDNVNVNDNVNDDVNDNENVNENPTGSYKKKCARHKYGEFGHVRLTDDDLARLEGAHGQAETQAAIKAVDEYCESTGKTYKNYALVMERWGYKSAAEKEKPSGYVDAIAHRFDPIKEWLAESGET